MNEQSIKPKKRCVRAAISLMVNINIQIADSELLIHQYDKLTAFIYEMQLDLTSYLPRSVRFMSESDLYIDNRLLTQVIFDRLRFCGSSPPMKML